MTDADKPVAPTEKTVGPKEKPVNLTVGALGEQAAADWYASHGYTVLARNVRESHREIDLIVCDAQCLVFVEVKARTQRAYAPNRFGRPADAVDTAKRERTVRTANDWLREHPTSLQPRIDVVEVYMDKLPDGSRRVGRVLTFRNAVKAK